MCSAECTREGPRRHRAITRGAEVAGFGGLKVGAPVKGGESRPMIARAKKEAMER